MGASPTVGRGSHRSVFKREDTVRYGGSYVLCETTTAQVSCTSTATASPVLIETLRVPMSAGCCQTVSPRRRSPPTTIDARNMNAISPICHAEPSRPFPGRRNRAGVRQSVNRCRNLLSRMPEKGVSVPPIPPRSRGPLFQPAQPLSPAALANLLKNPKARFSPEPNPSSNIGPAS